MSNEHNSILCLMAGTVGGIGAVLVGHPWDTIKVNLQSNIYGRNSGFFSVIKDLYFSEGIKGFYKGITAPLIGVTPIVSLSFFGYAIGRNLLQKPAKTLTYKDYFISGAISGIFTTPIITPFDRIKCLLQIQSLKSENRGIINCLKNIRKTEGLKGFYKGTGITMVKELPGNGIYFLVYEYFIRNLPYLSTKREERSPIRTMIAGGLSGVSYWTYSIIPDVIKTRYQTAPDGKYASARCVLQEIIKLKDYRFLFRGYSAVILRSFQTSGICFLGYEQTLKFLTK